jgi:porphobilinogen deaminase
MNADCQTPIAALAEIIDGSKTQGQFLLAEQNGSAIYAYSQIFDIAHGYEVGIQAAQIVVNASLNK